MTSSSRWTLAAFVGCCLVGLAVVPASVLAKRSPTSSARAARTAAHAPSQGAGGQSRASVATLPPTEASLQSPFVQSPFAPAGSLAGTDGAAAQTRTAFAHLDRARAVALAERTFHLQAPTWSAPGSEPGTRVTRYLSANSASEERPGGKHVFVQSTLPLLSDRGKGAPVSVALRARARAFVPANPLVPLSIAKQVAGGTSFSSADVTVAPASAGGGEAPTVLGNRLIWANTARDTDFISEPLPAGIGVEDSWQLRSADSPQENALVFKLPAGAKLRTRASGDAEVETEGHPLLLIPRASAHDAAGRALPVSYSVSGDRLVTHVSLAGNVQFPVLLDPEIIGWYGEAGGDDAWQNWQTYSTCGGCFGFPEYPNLIQTGAEVGWPEGQYGEWYIGVPVSLWARVTRVDVTGLTHQPENQATLNIGIYGSNGSGVYSENGYAGATGPAPLLTNRAYAGQSMAFCADGAGGTDGGAQPLCNENYGGEGFWFADDLLANRNVFNWASISSATI